MTETTWNRKQTIKIANWLSKHKTKQSKLVAEWCSNGTGEIRLYATVLDSKPHVVVRVFGVFDLFIDTQHKTAHKRCWNKSMLYETIREWYLKGDRT